jgi:hypothetical protein
MLSVVPYQPFDLMMQNPKVKQKYKPYLLTIEYVYLLAQKSNLTISVNSLDSIPIKALAAAIINNNKAT